MFQSLNFSCVQTELSSLICTCSGGLRGFLVSVRAFCGQHCPWPNARNNPDSVRTSLITGSWQHHSDFPSSLGNIIVSFCSIAFMLKSRRGLNLTVARSIVIKTPQCLQLFSQPLPFMETRKTSLKFPTLFYFCSLKQHRKSHQFFLQDNL